MREFFFFNIHREVKKSILRHSSEEKERKGGGGVEETMIVKIITSEPLFNCSREFIVIRKTLQPCTFSYSEDSILLWMYHCLKMIKCVNHNVQDIS